MTRPTPPLTLGCSGTSSKNLSAAPLLPPQPTFTLSELCSPATPKKRFFPPFKLGLITHVKFRSGQTVGGSSEPREGKLGGSGELRKTKERLKLRGDPIFRVKTSSPEGSQGCLRPGCPARKGCMACGNVLRLWALEESAEDPVSTSCIPSWMEPLMFKGKSRAGKARHEWKRGFLVGVGFPTFLFRPNPPALAGRPSQTTLWGGQGSGSSAGSSRNPQDRSPTRTSRPLTTHG